MEDKFNLPKITKYRQLILNATARQIVQDSVEQYERKNWHKIAIYLRLYNIYLSPTKIQEFSRIIYDYTSQQQSDMYKQALTCKFNYLILNEYFSKVKVRKQDFNRICRNKFANSIRGLNTLFLRKKIQTNSYFLSGRITTPMLFFQSDELQSRDINIWGIIESAHKLHQLMIKFEDVYNFDRTKQYSYLKELTNRREFTQVMQDLIYTNEIIRIAEGSTKFDSQILLYGKQSKYPRPLECKLLKKTIKENQETEFYKWVFMKLSNKSVLEKFSNISYQQCATYENQGSYIIEPFQKQNLKKVRKTSKISNVIKPTVMQNMKMETFRTRLCQAFHDDIQRDIQDAEEEDSLNNLFDDTHKIDDEFIQKQMEKDQVLRTLIETKTKELRLQIYKDYSANVRAKLLDNLQE